MKKLLLLAFLLVPCSVFAGNDDISVDRATNVFGTQVVEAAGSYPTVRVGLVGTVPSVVLNSGSAGVAVIRGNSGSVSVTGGMVQVPNTAYSAVQISTSFSPVGLGFAVINGTGTLTLTSTPHIATTTAVSGQEITFFGGANPVTFVDEGTLTGSLLELGGATRALGAGDMLTLRYYGGKWYEVSFANN